jgi:hypothetical protein
MGTVMIGNFGLKDGLQVYRVCGLKEDIEKLVQEAIEMDAEFSELPYIEHIHNGQWSVLLKIKIPVGVG